MTDSAGSGPLANLIIAGVNKAGSTSLFHYLTSHPDVCGSIDKETCYFLPDVYNKDLLPVSAYEAQFLHCKDATYRMEATPGYMYGGHRTALKIKNTLGRVKIIIILKDPVDRLISYYQRKKSTLQLPSTIDFKEYIKRCFDKSPEELLLRENSLYTGVSNGLYHQYIEPWLELYKEDIKIIFFDDIKKDSRTVVKDICNWLEIDPDFYDQFDFDVKNKSMNYRNRYLQQLAVNLNNAGQRFWRTNPELKKKLLKVYYNFNGTPFQKDEIDKSVTGFMREYYKPHNEQLLKILQSHGVYNFPAWLEPVKVFA